jgi:hypothetical protein
MPLIESALETAVKSIKFSVGAMLLLGAWVIAHAACPSVPSTSRFVLNGAEVTDQSTGLVWARCSAGQAWDDTTCTGTASRQNHQSSLQLAQATTGWRLPTVKELASLVDRGCNGPAIDTVAFPNTPNYTYWSATPEVRYAQAWSVDFAAGYVDRGFGRTFAGAVRLVRAGQ